MIAFVLGGGGNRGALQVGALQVLLEAGIVPDMVVGASVGAINGAYIAHDPTVRGTQELARLWSKVTRDDLYPGNYLTALWSIVRGKEGLFSNENWYKFMRGHFRCATFREVRGARCHIAATELNSGKIHVFGDDPNDPVVESLMASCALPPLHPPYWVNGKAYIDGGATANLPLRIALERGATQIYALNIINDMAPRKQRNVLDVSARAVEAILQRQIDLDLEHCVSCDKVRVRQIDLIYNGDLQPWDFSQTTALIARGRAAAKLALAKGPLRPPNWQERLSEGKEQLRTTLADATSQLGTMLWPKEPAEQPSAIRPRPRSGD